VSVRHDTSDWPIARVRFSPDYTREDTLAHLDWVKSILPQGRFGLVYDLRGVRAISAMERLDFVGFLRSNRLGLRLNCRGVGIVGASQVHRGVVRALDWTGGFSFPLAYFSGHPAAERWLHRQLRDSQSEARV